MPTIKTAISIDKVLHVKADKLAKQMHMSRSKLYSQAIEYLITRDKEINLVKEINKAYGDSPQTKEDQEFLKGAARSMAEILKDEKW